MRRCSASVVTPPMLRARSGLYSTAILKPTKCSKKPEVIRNRPTTTAAVSTVRVVMEMVLTLPVGPESHINCMHESCVSVSLGWPT